MHLFKPDAGKASEKMVPSTVAEIQKFRSAGYYLAEKMVDTITGHVLPMSAENSVNSGRGVLQAMSLVRTDPGNEDEPAFVTKEIWDKYSDERKKKLVVKRVGANRPVAKNAALAAVEAANARAEVAEELKGLTARTELAEQKASELAAELAALRQAKGGKGGGGQ
jgi:hypothetical protein